MGRDRLLATKHARQRGRVKALKLLASDGGSFNSSHYNSDHGISLAPVIGDLRVAGATSLRGIKQIRRGHQDFQIAPIHGHY